MTLTSLLPRIPYRGNHRDVFCFTVPFSWGYSQFSLVYPMLQTLLINLFVLPFLGQLFSALLCAYHTSAVSSILWSYQTFSSLATLPALASHRWTHLEGLGKVFLFLPIKHVANYKTLFTALTYSWDKKVNQQENRPQKAICLRIVS